MSLILNKKFSEIARANVSKLSVHLELLGRWDLLKPCMDSVTSVCVIDV